MKYIVLIPGPGSADDNKRIVWWQLGEPMELLQALKAAESHRKIDLAMVRALI